MNSSDRKRIQELTMACWWPSGVNPIKSPDWDSIADELCYLAESAITCRSDKTEQSEALRLVAIVRDEELAQALRS